MTFVQLTGGVAHARRSQRGSLASKTSRDGGKQFNPIFFEYFILHSVLSFVFLERAVPLSVDHFNQNGNIKNIGHIDAEAIVDHDNDENVQKAVQNVTESMNEKISLEKSDIEMASRDSKSIDKKDTVKEKGGEENHTKEDRYYLFRYPKHKRIWQQVLWIIIWPMEFIFLLTIPNCEQKRFKNLFPFTFLMCIVWIGSLSYLVAWMITIVGELNQREIIYIFFDN